MKSKSFVALLLVGALSLSLPGIAQVKPTQDARATKAAATKKDRAQKRAERQRRQEAQRKVQLAERRARNAKRQAELAKRRAEISKRRKAQQELREARGFRRFKLAGDENANNVATLASALTWHDCLESAQRAAMQTGKPIFYVQALGDLEGYT